MEFVLERASHGEIDTDVFVHFNVIGAASDNGGKIESVNIVLNTMQELMKLKEIMGNELIVDDGKIVVYDDYME